MRRFLNKRFLLIAGLVLLLIPISAIIGLYVFVNSPQFSDRVRAAVVERIASYTGARVSLDRLRWSFKDQSLVLENLTLRGTESESEPPLARIESIAAGLNFRTLLERRLDLSDLTIVNPEFHLRVDAQGRTNIPGPTAPKTSPTPETEFVVSIDALKITGGKGVINDRRFDIELSLSNLVSDLRYNTDTQVLSAQLAYDGILKHPGQPSIPYKMSSELDFTRGTILARKVGLNSGRTSVNLQGRIDNVLNGDIAGKLDYSGRADSAFLKRFLPGDIIAAGSTARGFLEFSAKRFSTKGDLSTESVEWKEWKTGPLKAAFSYDSSTKQLNLSRVSTELLGGSVGGKVAIYPLPGQPRFTVELNYTNMDVAQLSHVSPWDPKYRVYSRADGALNGWFEGRLDQYEFENTSALTPYSPTPEQGIIALPVRGTLIAGLTPGRTEIRSSDIQFFDTRVQAEGSISGADGDLVVTLESKNLANLFFLHAGANGEGSFHGVLKGPLEKPILEGQVVLDDHKYREWTIRHAAGGIKLDMKTEMADLRNVELAVGESSASINGSVRLDGGAVNLTVRSDRLHAEEFQSLIKEKVEGILSGTVALASLDPVKATGSFRSARMRLRGHTFENVEGSFTYDEPAIELRNLKASEGSARLDADVVRFNPSTGTIDARANIASLPLSQLKEFGVPDTLDGTIQTAFLTIAGTRDKPQIGGNVVIENFSFRGETFPRARLELETRWPILHVEVSQTQNVRLEADIDLATAQYPFKASASFTDYSLERLAQFSRGKLTASGTVDFTGQLAGQASFSGQGVIRAITANIRDIEFQNAAPFEFAFDTKRIRLDKEATFRGAYGTRVNVKGYVGLENSPPLDLEITGNLDLSEVTEANEFLSVTGSVGLIARVGGTTANPTINGNARITGGSLGRQGIYTTVSNLNGDVRFNENRMTFDNLRGQVGGGNIEIRGAGLIQNSQIEGLNVRIDAEDVNLRYPAGMRSRVTGALSLTGTSSAPVLSGDLRLVSLTFRSEFEAFLVMFRQYSGLNSGGSVLDRLRLAIHVEGNRNIIVQNELTDITEARIDLDVGGTWARPTLTGHIDITGGALLFSGERYEITRGNIDFVDRLKIDPVVDIQAETDLRDYRVILNVSGSGENIRVVPTSDPALPDVELVSLIAGGKTTDELERARSETPLGGSTPGNSSLPTSEELFPTAAATIFTDLLRSRVGSRLGLMGLDLIRIDPQFESATNNPSVRVTLSQQVSKDLSVTYSQDLSSSQQRLIMVEYFVSKNLSIVASREETNETSALGLDIKLRKRF